MAVTFRNLITRAGVRGCLRGEAGLAETAPVPASLPWLLRSCFAVIAVVALVPLQTMHAQEVSGGVREFTVLAGGEANWCGLSFQRSTSEATPLAFSSQRRSTSQKAPAGALVFTRERVEPATGKSMPVAVARASWPAGVRTALLVFVPRTAAGADGIEFDVLAVDDGMEAFPAGAARILNLTPVPLLARIGEREAQVAQGFSPVFRLADMAAGQASVALALGMRTPDAGVTALYLGPLETRANLRTLVMVQPPKVAGSRKVKVNVIGQSVPASPVK